MSALASDLINADNTFPMNVHAELTGDVLVLENSLIRREYRWNGGNVCSRRLVDTRTGRAWVFDGSVPDGDFPGESVSASEGRMAVLDSPPIGGRPGCLKVETSCMLGMLEVKRVFRLYEDCPAIGCDFYLRGRGGGSWRDESGAAPRLGIENPDLLMGRPKPAPVLERMALAGRHWRLRCVEFFDRTDYRNTVVQTRELVPYGVPMYLSGNLLLGRDVLDQAGFFILKESPGPEAQPAYPGFDFVVSRDHALLAGVGMDPCDLNPRQWVRAYGFVTGVAAGTEDDLVLALRSYQHCLRQRHDRRDRMILLNTWGDRSQDGRIGETFARAELAAARRLGVTHFCLDDGWQQGLSPNSGQPGGSFNGIWDRPDYWHVHAERFPRGLDPVAADAKAAGVELALWFNPCPDDDYRHWQEDADVLIGMFKQYGIRVFKIDGVDIPNKAADRNMRAFFERVVEATDHEVVFNLDITAGRRYGYHYFNEYGHLFLENRYTDWGNYYPHWTLRNLWMLSRYVPPQCLQIEFLNRWRNTDKYPADDPLAPAGVPWDYAFAVTMMAQPLAWFEASRLPEDAFALAPVLETYRQHQEKIYAGRIVPIGEEPSGGGWTGFQSVGKDGGYVLIFREQTPRPAAAMKLWTVAENQRLRFTKILGQGEDFTAPVTSEGSVSFSLPAPMNYALYEYVM